MSISSWLDGISAVLLTGGALLTVISAIGLIRFRYTFMRIHASSVAETGGMLLLVAGMLLQSPDWLTAVKLLLIAILLLMTNPVASHALARSALHDGYQPKLQNPASHQANNTAEAPPK